MKRIFIFILFFYGFLNVSAQYTKIINSKRPGFSESPYGVGTKVFQLETGGFYQSYNTNQKETFLSKDGYGGNLFLRYGNFLEKLEVNLDFTYQKDQRIFRNIFTSNQKAFSGISRLTLGAKYLVYNAVYKDKSKEIHSWKKRHAFDWSRLIPSVGVYVGWNSNFLSKNYKASGMSLKGAVLLQNDINERFVILTNLVVDQILFDELQYSYIFTSTLAVTEKWSIFGEHQGIFNKSKDTEYQFGGGLAYLLTDNVQLDISGRTSLIANEFSAYYLSVGGAWRMDRHQDKRKSTETLEGTREPFFKRIFKKNKSKKRKVKKIKVKKRRKSKKSKGPSFFDKKKKSKKRKRGKKKKRRRNKD
jgi:hypothetical protein